MFGSSFESKPYHTKQEIINQILDAMAIEIINKSLGYRPEEYDYMKLDKSYIDEIRKTPAE
ncbi:hypothetical protein NST17_19895 [Caldifermentibacillus hisashii]|uniref:Uncharacterized protein n=1 Tax=Caldifermentibacillus hisashii TaxID=996558 RepID=A0ABU9K3M2_9BACI